MIHYIYHKLTVILYPFKIAASLLWSWRRKLCSTATMAIIIALLLIPGLAVTSIFIENLDLDLKWFGLWGVGVANIFWPLARIDNSIFSHNPARYRISKSLKLFFLSLISHAMCFAILLIRLEYLKFNGFLSKTEYFKQILSCISDNQTAILASIFFGLHAAFLSMLLFNLFMISLPTRFILLFESLRSRGWAPNI